MAENSSPPAENEPTTPSFSILELIGIMMGPFLSMIDSNIVNVALPAISSSLAVSLQDAQWVVSAYLLSWAAFLSATAYLGKRFGPSRVYLVSLVGFTLGSLLCALSTSLPVLIVARIIQGALGAPLIPLSNSMALGGGRRPQDVKGMYWLAIILFVGPAIGPSIGGLLLNLGSWHAVFLINIPIGLFGIIVAARVVRRRTEERDRSVRFDPFGLTILSLGVAGIAYGTAQGPVHGWFSSGAMPFWIAGSALVCLYVVVSYRKEHPAVNLRLLANTFSAAAVSIMVLTSVVVFAIVVLVPLFMERFQGYSPFVTGLTLIPQAIIAGVGTALSDRVRTRLGVRATAITGMILVTAGTLLMLVLNLSTQPWVTSIILIVRAFSIGLVTTPLLFEFLALNPGPRSVDANTLFMVSQRVGGGVGIALLTTFFATRATLAGVAAAGASGAAAALSPAVAAFHESALILCLVAAAGVLVAIAFVREPSALPARLHEV